MMNQQEMQIRAAEVWSIGSEELGRLRQTIDTRVFADIVMIIAQCKGRIITAGVGTSGVAARKIAHSLSCIERPALFLSPGDAVHGALGVAQPGDVAILISKGGGTREIMNIVPGFQTKGIPIIGVTENSDSPLANASRMVLKIRVEREADTFNMLATTSTMAVIAVFDAVCIVLMDYTGYTKDQFAVIHPAGAVGERLTAKDRRPIS